MDQNTPQQHDLGLRVTVLRLPANAKVTAAYLCLLCLLAGCATRSASVSVADKKLQPGDCLLIRFVSERDDLVESRVIVDGDGNLTLKWVGKLRATGKTLAQIQEDIHASYVPHPPQDLSVSRCEASTLHP